MAELITLSIDGKTIHAKEGETLLNVARANGIFIPALCYLTRCSPTLACRLCLVEADGKQVYSCNAKVKADMQVSTSTDNIVNERNSIMQVYDVNHPLQCGVCDKSGECELQNYTLYMKVNEQKYSIKDIHRPKKHWGVMNYDPSLCIVCEKCVTVCKDMIGSNALSTTKRGADAIATDFKQSMPKDAYAMWNKLNKSLIAFDKDRCTDCGECISVCPVGALVSHDFQYKSNAWELTRVPASNPHSSDCTLMYYETKHESINQHQTQKIYRVSNEHHYASLNGAGRFAYDFENKVQYKDENAFAQAIEAFKKANSIVFNSYITNEEAFILNELKKELGCKLINEDAKRYQDFIKTYSRITSKSLYDATLKSIHSSDFVISMGSFLKSDSPNTKYAFNNSVLMNKGAGLYFHPIKDPVMELIGKKGKTTEFISHKIMSEASILYLILDLFGKDLPESIQNILNLKKEQRTRIETQTIKEEVIEIVKDEETLEEKEVKKLVPKKVSTEVAFEYTTLLDDMGANEELLQIIETMKEKKEKYSLILGEDIIFHPQAKELAKLCALISSHTVFDVFIIPSQTNTLGVSLICDLDEEQSGYTVGYNMKSDFQLSALGDGDLDMPALNQQEGSFVNCDKRLVPTNAALPYKGYVLNDLANELLDKEVEFTIEYTKYLPLEKGFKSVEFDALTNYFSNDMCEHRGYEIESNHNKSQEIEDDFKCIKNIEIKAQQDEVLIYRANPINQFNEFTAIAHEMKEKLQSGLFVSKQLLESLGFKNEEKIIILNDDLSIETHVYLDEQIEGEIAYVSTFDKELNTQALFKQCRYSTALVKKA